MEISTLLNFVIITTFCFGELETPQLYGFIPTNVGKHYRPFSWSLRKLVCST